MYLLTGGSGVLGTELQKQGLMYNFKCWAPSSRELDITDDHTLLWIQDNRDKLKNTWGVVHCAAYTDVPGAETPEGRRQAVAHNIRGTNNMFDIALVLGVKFVYISSDYVYPGETGNYSEEDTVRPVNYYAMTKLIGESFVTRPDDLIIRTSFKPNIKWPYPKAFDDLYTSCDYVDVIAPKILDLIGNQESGIYNVGTERKSIYDLARRRTTKVKPMSRTEIKDVHLPSDISMNLDKFNEYYDAQYGCDAPDCCPRQ